MTESSVSRRPPRKPIIIKFGKQSRTQQKFKKECDINYILRNYSKTGVLGHINVNSPKYGMVPSVDFTTAMNLVKDAENTWSQIDSGIRKEFDNDLTKFLAFVENPENTDRLIELGLANAPEPEPEPAPEPPAPPEPDPT